MYKDELGNLWSAALLQEELRRCEAARKKRQPEMPTLTSGFGKEVLRLTSRDIEFMMDCGIRVE